jgi:hypothetical protein
LNREGEVTPDEVRARAAAAGIAIPEDRIPAFVRSVGQLRAALEPLRRDLAQQPIATVFGGGR